MLKNTWNVRPIKVAGKLEDFRTRWRDTSEASLDSVKLDRNILEKLKTDGGHRKYFRANEDRHEQGLHGMGFLVHTHHHSGICTDIQPCCH